MADPGDPAELLRLARWRARWVRLSPLGRDITVVLVVKLAALGLLWWAFFSHPAARPMTVDPAPVDAHLLPSASPEEFPHADR
jgi:uncharacterized membrane protein